ncbi:KpsF/GutQ family sugar-phosphate isomerase [Rhodoblastus acidophilus]|uniref:KpsF/GutQ family sugar-phosphate isomerase n=1 Tax=Candidatus Rhodoblastus alkanivorans TaxID=2954117 RepID=A0ABS9Z2U8_9HYPH|nr:KpsF/GutQ family sugar-phosphate isomerase [Candidatus Rhodoblastus alkanivorans]MCI4679761.1 KpsF/GutQ family sugar-phosphate isomerase [Candidatus Rhodoblastus alkanivorans]MCI4681999.1 KpsF/GutQ family sugar-phosphate isomerase [Candidatus Rhodoblastus alkanivorans]MDI4643050.1 KpsF/GutQ family sugar-phosphate isomerase [Rhodoblastus acidophilus]
MNSIALEAAQRSVEIEAAGVASLRAALDGELGAALEKAIATIRAARGRVIVSGMGKSGHIGRKVAATLASTGTPAFFLHPAEASHGDLGMVTQDDVVLAFSWSGETVELADLIEYAKRFAIPLIAAASRRDSALGRAADILLELPQVEEACPNGLAPTTSTTIQLVLGDALAVALIEDRGFSAQDFRQFHPGGKLGARLHKVDDLMHAGEDMPLLSESAAMSEVILTMTGKRFGCVGLVDDKGRLSGIITDGDLRRHWSDLLQDKTPREIMTRAPLTAPRGALASSALETMNRRKITVLFIVEDGKPAGILHIHDLLRAGVA